MSELRRGFDAHGNPESRAFDLGGMDNDRVRGERILLYLGYLGNEWNDALLKAAVAERGFQMDIHRAPGEYCDLDERTLAQYQQLWYVSPSFDTLDTPQVAMIAGFVQRGNGLAIWADNDPFFADANLLAEAITGATFSGDQPGEAVLTPADHLSPGHFIAHPLTQGMNNLHEGHTICSISSAPDVTLLGQSHDGQMCIGAFERGEMRVVLDTGFTKLWGNYFNQTAGTARYLRNIAFWLARGSRGVEYRLMTQPRQGMATISAGQTSQPYIQTVTEPVELTFMIQWEGGATLGLQARDPSGAVAYEHFSASAPLRATVNATTRGDWVAFVSGAQINGPSVPYVLTISIERARALPPTLPVAPAAPPITPPVTPPAVQTAPALPSAQATPVAPLAPVPVFAPPEPGPTLSVAPVQPAAPAQPAAASDPAQPFIPLYLILDTSSAAAGLTPGLRDGVARLAERLRARPTSRVDVRLAALTTGGLVAPLAAPDPTQALVVSGQGENLLGGALAALFGELPNKTARAKPLIVALLASPPAGDWTSYADQLKIFAANLAARVIVVGLDGYADRATLRRLTPTAPYAAPGLTPERLGALFDWLYTLADWAIRQREGGPADLDPPAPPTWMEAVR